MHEKLYAVIRFYMERIIARFYVPITLLSLVVSALAIWVIATTWNINSDFKALLPETAPAALAMTEVADRVGSGSALFVVIDSPSQEANLKFAEVYSKALRELPSVALAHYHNDKEFFEKHQLLYMDASDIKTLRERIEKSIHDKKKESNPLFVSLRKKKDDGVFVDTSDIEQKYSNQVQDEYKEYLISDDGYSLTIIVRFVESSTDLVATNTLLDRVRALSAELNPQSYHPEMVVELGGGLVNRQKEYTSIVDDIITSAIFTVVGLFTIIALYFRRLRAVALVMGPLIMGIVWTLATAFVIYGELTTITVFIFAILLGLGIDFAIHLLAGYDHERLNGHEPVDALIHCFMGTGKATVLGGLTTFATFFVLSFAQFKGLAQFGTVASMGIVYALIGMLMVMPAMLLTMQRVKPYLPKAPGKDAPFWDRHVNNAMVEKWSRPALIFALLFSAFSIFEFHNVRFEENFRKIGVIEPVWIDRDLEQREADLKALERQAQQTARAVFVSARSVRESLAPDTFVMDREQKSVGSKYNSAVSGKQSSTPTIMLFDDAKSTQQVYSVMKKMHDEGELKTVRSVASIFAFLPGTPEQQEERMVEIRALKEVLDREGTTFLNDEQKKTVEDLQHKLDVSPVTLQDLPDWTKRLFREVGAAAKPAAEGEEFAYEYLIYINEAIDQMRGDEARKFLGEVAEVAEITGEDLRIGSQSYIYVAMLDEIKTDGVKMLGIALIVVVLILGIGFGGPLRGLISMIPLIIGTFWMFGMMGWFGIKLDFFNVVIVPVVIGIGVDDGVHFYQRYLDKGRGSEGIVFRQIGSAIVMTSITSMIGFGGLATTNYAGLQSIGYVAMTGITCTLFSTLLLMPSLIWAAEKLNWTWVLPPEKLS